MTRVSENSTQHSVNYSVGKAKSKLEDLQIKGSNLKRIQKPSDDPVGNVELLLLRSKNTDSEQYGRNSSFARIQLNMTESALEDLYEIVVKAKEIAVTQASDFYNPEIRQGIAKEISQLRNQAIGIGNRRLGNRYLFGGHKTLTRPFDQKGIYYGDNGKINIEVDKDFFVPVNLTGRDIFFGKGNRKVKEARPLEGTPFEYLDGIEKRANLPLDNNKEAPKMIESEGRDLASLKEPPPYEDKVNHENAKPMAEEEGLLTNLKTLENALLTNSPEIVQVLLETLDQDISNIVQLRAELGSITNTIDNAEATVGKHKVYYEELKSKIEDADVADLYTELTKQENVLKATYKVSNNLMSRSLMDFIN